MDEKAPTGLDGEGGIEDGGVGGRGGESLINLFSPTGQTWGGWRGGLAQLLINLFSLLFFTLFPTFKVSNSEF